MTGAQKAPPTAGLSLKTRKLCRYGLVAGAGALFDGGVVGVGAGVAVGGAALGGAAPGAPDGAFCEVVVVVGVPPPANSSQAPIARMATTSRIGSTLQLPSSLRLMSSQPVRGGRSRGR